MNTETKWLGGSLVAWAGFAVSIIGAAITYGTSTAAVQLEVKQLTITVDRNRTEALDRIKTVESSVSNLYSSMSAIHSIKTDVEVIKEQIKSINDSMRRLERQSRHGGRTAGKE